MEYVKREVRNDILSNLKNLGFSQKVIGTLVDLSQQMVSKIYKKQSNGLGFSKHLGIKRRLSPVQLESLAVFLSKGAEFYGFEGAYWTHQRVAFVIKQEFDVTYEVKQAGRILKLIGWTRQKPQKKDAKQDLSKVEKWQTEGLAALKKKP